MGKPESTLLCFRSKKTDFNIFYLAEALDEMGWHMERARLPDSIHCTVMPQHSQVKEKFVNNMNEAMEIVRKNPEKFKDAANVAAYGMLNKLPDPEIGEDFLVSLL